ncbi:Cytochrome b-c1 complex subunit 9 [Tupaia chinensis]|uniref:Cytochrome b-c1 complex subunit 9 n=1 Tax=Tupaia chinensis TaxID=246437 RepID=L9LA47_TUPCH|nr:Cytochrome b-c1 complex subunit 9 [Tupaia chinensis]
MHPKLLSLGPRAILFPRRQGEQPLPRYTQQVTTWGLGGKGVWWPPTAGSCSGDKRQVTMVENGTYFGRMPTFALTIVVRALFFQRAFDQGVDAVYEHISHGKLWRHIKHKYKNKE